MLSQAVGSQCTTSCKGFSLLACCDCCSATEVDEDTTVGFSTITDDLMGLLDDIMEEDVEDADDDDRPVPPLRMHSE